MQYKTYGVIEVSSYGVSLKVYEISRKNGILPLDHVRYPLEIGKDSYGEGRIHQDTVDELCELLKDFVRKMKSYNVEDYIAITTSAIRLARNSDLVLDQVKQRTGVDIRVYSNSELRFITYKAVASRQTDFQKIIQKGTAFVDVGGGSVQVSLFDKDNLITTQNLLFGSLRIREKLSGLVRESNDYENLITELTEPDIASFRKMHLKDRKISNVILTGDYISSFMVHNPKSFLKENMTREEFMAGYGKLIRLSAYDVSRETGISSEYASLLIPTAVVYKIFLETFEADNVWIPGIDLSDGFAYEYAENNRLIRIAHNFDNDIVMAARNIGKRYAISKSHAQIISEAALNIFDSMKRVHGMGQRERLLLDIAVHVHDVGKYISMSQVGDCSYNIIMATEIIGLSHRERQIIALAVKYNTIEFPDLSGMREITNISTQDYVLVAKLTAILRVANCLDRAHKQKVRSMKVVLQDERLILRLETTRDFTLEKGLLTEKLDFFDDVFNVRPEIRLKRIL